MFARLPFMVIAFAANGMFFGGQVALASQPPTEFSLTLSAPQPTVKDGQPVMVNVIVKNISDHLLGVEEDRGSAQEVNYEVTVREKSGNEAPTSAFHRLLRGKPLRDDQVVAVNPNELLVPLDPGKSLTDPIDLTKLYSLRPGVYSVQVERIFGSQAPVRSNAVTITVTP